MAFGMPAMTAPIAALFDSVIDCEAQAMRAPDTLPPGGSVRP